MTIPQSDITYLNERGIAHEIVTESARYVWSCPSGYSRVGWIALQRISSFGLVQAIQILLLTCGGSPRQYI